MGVIIRQSIKNSLVNYMGAMVGILSTLLIYPLDRYIYGYAQFLYSTAFFLVPFASFGISALILKYYPTFKNDSNRDNGFFGLTLIWGLLGYGFLLLVFYFFKEQILLVLSELGLDENKISENLNALLILCLLLFLMGFLSNHIANQKRIVVPNILQSFLFKIFLPVVIFLHYIEFLSKDEFTLAYLWFYAFLVFVLLIYLLRISNVSLKPNFSFINRDLKKQMLSYLGYSGLNSIGNQLVYRVDIIMVALLLDFNQTGSYGVFLMLTIFLDIPMRSILQISSPVISNSWKENDLENINSIYTKSSIVLLIVGIFMFLCAWICINEIVELSTNTEVLMQVKYVFFYLGIAKLVEMSTSVNSQIIMYSKHYRYNLFFILLTGIITVITNYMLINKFGIVGAAMATCLTLFFVNFIKVVFIRLVFKMQPFGWNSFLTIIIGVLAYGIMRLYPLELHPIIDLVLKSLCFSIIFILPVWFFKLSPDINNFVKKNLEIVIKKVK